MDRNCQATARHLSLSKVMAGGLAIVTCLSVAATASVMRSDRVSLTALQTSSSSTSAGLKWDFDNKLQAVDTDNDGIDDVSFAYDALGRRVSRSDGNQDTVYANNGQQVIADYTAGANPSASDHNYVFASYVDEPILRDGADGKKYFHRNQQYSVVGLTDDSGVVAERYAYDAYGAPTIADASGSEQATSLEGNRYLYTGREYDEISGLYHYRARTYDHAAGRFCSRDPIEFEGSQWNLYEYVENGPLVNKDPFGLRIESEPIDYRERRCFKTSMRQISPVGPPSLQSGPCRLIFPTFNVVFLQFDEERTPFMPGDHRGTKTYPVQIGATFPGPPSVIQLPPEMCSCPNAFKPSDWPVVPPSRILRPPVRVRIPCSVLGTVYQT